MQVRLLSSVCVSLIVAVSRSELETSKKEDLKLKITGILEEALNPETQSGVEELLHTENLVGSDINGAKNALFSRLSSEVLREESHDIQEKVTAVTKELLIPKPAAGKAKRSVQFEEWGTASDGSSVEVHFGAKDDPSVIKKALPFGQIRHLQEELDKPIKSSGVHNAALKKLVQVGYKTKRDILKLPYDRIAKITGCSKHEAGVLLSEISGSLKKEHEDVLDSHLQAFLRSVGGENIDPNGYSISDLFKGDMEMAREFNVLLDTLVEAGYDPGFKISNRSTEDLSSERNIDKRALERILYEVRAGAFARKRVQEFRSIDLEKGKVDLQSPFCQLFESLLANFLGEREVFLDKLEIPLVKVIFQEVVDEKSELVQEGLVKPADAFSDLKGAFFNRVVDGKEDTITLTPEEFKELPRLTVPMDIKRALDREIREGKWESGVEKEVSFTSLSPKGERDLLVTSDLVFNNQDFEAAALHYFTSI